MHKSSPAFSWRSAKERFELVANHSRGKIISFTKVWMSPRSFEEQIPYIIGLIELDSGKRIFGQVIGDYAKIGDKVEACLRRQYTDGNSGIIEYGTKFRVIK